MPIFSGNNSIEMWNEINDAKSIKDLRGALYTVCCKLQEAELRIEQLEKKAHSKEKRKK